MMTIPRSMPIVMALVGTLFSTTVTAEVIRIQITGTVESLNDYDNALAGQVQVGQRVTGYYSYDRTAPDQDAHPGNGHFPQDPTKVSMSFEIGTLTFASATHAQPHGMYIADVANNSWGDGLHVGSAMNNLPLPNGSRVDHMDVDFYDPSATAFNSDALPAAPVDLSDFQEKNIYFSGQGSTGNYYDFRVRIDSQQLSSDDTPPPGTFQLVASITDVYDPGFAFGGMLQPGVELSGSYRLDLNLPDSDPNPEMGHYQHPKIAGYGFTLRAGGYSFQSDSTTEPVFVDIINSYSDAMHVLTNWGSVQPGALQAYYINLHLDDNSGTAFSSDALSADAPDLSKFAEHREIMIGGSDATGNYWSVQAQIVSITAAVAEPAEPVIVTPSSGFFVRQQLVELAFLMPVGKQSETISGTVNAEPVSGWYIDHCRHEALWSNGREAVICSDIHPLLRPGVNNLTWTILFTDGTSVTESVKWEIFE